MILNLANENAYLTQQAHLRDSVFGAAPKHLIESHLVHWRGEKNIPEEVLWKVYVREERFLLFSPCQVRSGGGGIHAPPLVTPPIWRNAVWSIRFLKSFKIA